MEESKKRRLAYKRRWAAAKRAVVRTNKPEFDDSDDSDQEVNVLPSGDCQFDDDSDGTSIEAMPNSTVSDHDVDESTCRDDDVEWNWDQIDQHVVLSSDSDDEVEEKEVHLLDDLSTWANEFQVKHNAIDHLLKLLKKNGHPDLPSTARTLLKTAREVHTVVKSGMEYIYFGMRQELLENLKKYPLEILQNVTVLDISLNIDGLPLFRSSKKSLWPILCAIHLEPKNLVFPVALAFGKTKPTDLDFLQDTVTDLNQLLQHGLPYGDKTIEIILRCVICDAPAKAMIKAIKQFSGYYGCDKCNQKGDWVGRMTYQNVKTFEVRTDAAFRNQSNEQHHHGVTPFSALSIDLIKAFPIDYMHQACLGVMKRLLLAWKKGKRDVRMSASQIEEVSLKLLKLQRFVPNSFARKPRSLEDLEYWKATEYRQFLLYTGKIVLRGILRRDLFEHFMTFSVAISILVSPRLAHSQREYANELLVYFVAQGRNLYGPEFLVYNVHSMVHIASDVEEHGCLDRFSAFPFENYLQQVKRMVRSGKNPVAQVVKRIGELQNVQTIEQQGIPSVSMNKPNNAFILGSSSCCEVVAITNEKDDKNNKMLLCRVYERTESLFVQPCDSNMIGAYKVHQRNAHMKLLPATCLARRAMAIDLEEGTKTVFLAILHDF